jgi:hypothetical protein
MNFLKEAQEAYEELQEARTPLAKELFTEQVLKNDPIYKEYLQLKKLSVKELRNIAAQNHRVVDKSGWDKAGAIADILRNKHGDKKIDKVFDV